jgi:AcrR family transcriptional regulator
MTAPRFHPPRQSRSQETLDRILDAAESVMTEKSFSEATLAEIVERAGVTVGAFYRRFPDKDALIHHLDERFFAELHQTAHDFLDPSRWEGVSLEEIIPEFTRLAVGLFRARRGLMRSLFLRARIDTVLRDSSRAVNAYIIERLRALLLPRAARIRHPSPEFAITLGFIIMVGALRESVVFGEVWPDEVRIGDEHLAGELARVYLSYLGIAG